MKRAVKRAIRGVGTWMLLVATAVGALFTCSGCSEGGSAGDEGAPVRIVATMPALGWVARGLAPEGAEVTTLVGAGSDPHGFEPTPGQALAIADADVVLLVGAGLDDPVASILERSSRPHRIVATLAEVVASDPGLAPLAGDPHAWLDPVAMRGLIEVAAGAMEARGGLGDVATRRDALVEATRRVDRAYRARLAGLDDRRMVTHHNAWAYLAHRYGLEVVAAVRPVEMIEPTPNDLVRAVAALERIGARALFVEPAFNGAEAARIADAAGVELIEVDPVGGGDWVGMMMGNLGAFERGLGAAPDGGTEGRSDGG
jgi:ABC-type Zn uptake system ZnuABC Zn-binding protein ZnuA